MAALLVSFFRADQQLGTTYASLTQSSEIQWRFNQIRERTSRAAHAVEIASYTNKLSDSVDVDLQIAKTNISALLALPYAHDYLDQANTAALDAIGNDHIPRLRADIDRRAYGTFLTVSHSILTQVAQAHQQATENGTTIIDTAGIVAASRADRLGVLAALAALLGGLIMLYGSTRKKEAEAQYLQSFAALYSHVVQNRLSALRLYLDLNTESEERLDALQLDARNALDDLTDIDTKLRLTTFTPNNHARRDHLRSIVANLSLDGVQVDIEASAGNAILPEAATTIMLAELIENARAATAERPTPRIVLTGRIRNTWVPWPRSRLQLSVIDNGQGMTPAIKRDAFTPFFTTKAGHHNGLGLPACTRIARSMTGTLSLTSTENAGTTVTFTSPYE